MKGFLSHFFSSNGVIHTTSGAIRVHLDPNIHHLAGYPLGLPQGLLGVPGTHFENRGVMLYEKAALCAASKIEMPRLSKLPVNMITSQRPFGFIFHTQKLSQIGRASCYSWGQLHVKTRTNQSVIMRREATRLN